MHVRDAALGEGADSPEYLESGKKPARSTIHGQYSLTLKRSKTGRTAWVLIVGATLAPGTPHTQCNSRH